MNGVPAQGNQNPRSVFENHSMILYTKQNGEKGYLDPNYGIPSSGFLSSTNAYENASMAAMGSLIIYDAPVVGRVYIIWLNEFNNSTLQLNFK
jgi:hypothetical protein